MSYYRYHVFFCTNLREDGSPCCGRFDAAQMRDYMKRRCKELGLNRTGDGAGGVRINSAGCMDRCSEGPVMVVYPEAVWYTWVDRSDIDEIIERHLQQGQTVERLRI